MLINNSGSWSNRKSSVLQTEDSGATPDGIHSRSLVVQRQQRLAYNQNTTVRVRPRLIRQVAQVLPIGRATRLKIAWLRVRVPPWASIRTWLGRQLADHLGSNPGMLWVRLPPELLETTCVGWALACHGVHFGGHVTHPPKRHWRFNFVPTHSIKNGPFF